MSSTIVADICKIVVKAPERSFEIGLPADMPLVEVMPSLLEHGSVPGGDLDETGVEHGGWVLQRLGRPALDEESTPADLGLRDGETLHLRPRREQLPPVHFDDLVDGVATGMRERADQWGPQGTRRLALGFGSAVLLAGLVPLATSGLPLLHSVATAGVGLLLLLGAVGASRAVGDAVAGTTLGLLAIPYLFVAGWFVPAGPAGDPLLGARLLAGAAAGSGAAILALAAAASAAPLFTAVLLGFLLTAVGGALGLTAGLAPSEAAGPVAAVTVVLGTFVPLLSFRLAGLRLPPLPTNAQELQEGIDPVSSTDVLERTRVADRYMTALYAACGLLCAVCLVALSTGRGWEPLTLGAVLSVLLVLHARAMAGARQRLSVVLPGCLGLLLPALGFAWHGSPGTRALVLLVLLLVGAGLTIASWALPGRRLVPYWGRAADLLHSACAIALFPLVLIDLGALGALRAWLS
ncbi:type VII secretion integral membrane protein EccD [Streptomyces sp. BBFR2]|uniref:type VII secretion integral membrane protein EccD n=1 Tax=Streptomyces sp. BBFR2 TaxID=3372854 RepID=UPI0037D9C4C0